jgi:predicted ester cyclase
VSAEANKALVRRWFAEIDRGNLDIIDELLPVDYIDHNPPLPDLPPGREGVRESMRQLRAAFPDAVHTLNDQVAEGDKVMTRLTTRATFTGEIVVGQERRRYKPTGHVVEISGIAVHRIVDGRLVEHWAYMDMTGFVQQISETPEPATAH